MGKDKKFTASLTRNEIKQVEGPAFINNYSLTEQGINNLVKEICINYKQFNQSYPNVLIVCHIWHNILIKVFVRMIWRGSLELKMRLEVKEDW